jgi:hypothetical protein
VQFTIARTGWRASLLSPSAALCASERDPDRLAVQTLLNGSPQFDAKLFRIALPGLPFAPGYQDTFVFRLIA